MHTEYCIAWQLILKLFKKIICAVICITVLLPVTSVCAADIYENYTISNDYKELASPAAFLSDTTHKSFSWADDEAKEPVVLSSPSDMETYNDRLFVLDRDNARVVILNTNFEVVRIIDSYTKDQIQQKFNKPEGLTIASDGTLYVADTENSQIVKLTLEGELLEVLGRPDIYVLGEDYTYFPLKLAVDRSGRMYIIARGINRGLVVLDANNDFIRFAGAPRVTYDLFTMMWRKLLPRSAAKSMISFVPTEFSNIKIDDGMFLYTVIKSIDVDTLNSALQSKSQDAVKVVQRFNATDTDVLRRYGDVPIVGDVNWDLPSVTSSGVTSVKDITEGPSTFEDIVVDDYGTYYCIDSYRGKIFSYDSDGNLLYVFGSNSNQEGTVRHASAIEIFADRLIVLDRAAGLIVSYDKTLYGKSIEEASRLFSAGKYTEAYDKWSEVSRYNGNLTIAYLGMGKSAYYLGNYDTAMKYLKLAGEKEYYSKAFEVKRTEFLQEHFVLFFVVLVVLVGLVVVYALGLIKRKEKVYAKGSVWGSLKYATHLSFHPFSSFWDLKHEKRGTMTGATIILAVTVIEYVFQKQYSGYLFSSYNPDTFNVLLEIISVLLIVLLWVVANWCLTTLMDGEGNMKDVYIATCYSLTPLALFLIPFTLVSNTLTLTEQSYYNILLTGVFIWTAFLLFVSVLITHQYTVLKAIITCVLIIIGILIIIFIAILFYNLLQHMISFVLSSWQELSFRMTE